MKSVHIRNIDSNVLNALKRLAKAHRRSLQGELLFILENASKSALAAEAPGDIELVTVATDVENSFSREEIYGDDGR